MATPHLEAATGDFAPLVLLPGDPLRARHLAEALLDDARLVNSRRNMLAYTGRYAGRPVSVMGSGMGIPSCAIYATELAREHGVRRIVRIGTCGGIGGVALGDVLLAQAASTDSSFNRLAFGGYDLAACADFALLGAVHRHALATGFALRVANVFSTDTFYSDDGALLPQLRRHRIVGVEMESAGLYGVALREGIAALSVLAVSDHLEHDLHMPGDERERGLAQMARLVLDALCAGGV